MKYQWKQSSYPKEFCWVIHLDQRAIRLETYPMPYSNPYLANPSEVIKELLEIDGVVHVVVLDPYSLSFQFGELFDSHLIKKEVTDVLHQHIDPGGELIEMTS